MTRRDASNRDKVTKEVQLSPAFPGNSPACSSLRIANMFWEHQRGVDLVLHPCVDIRLRGVVQSRYFEGAVLGYPLNAIWPDPPPLTHIVTGHPHPHPLYPNEVFALQPGLPRGGATPGDQINKYRLQL